MNFKPHKAFSLTELIIVLVIIAVLFAAMAPIITKRHIADTAGVENIWNFVNNDTERDV
jgi:prepilin-type N-terminal cleavage/methylation domain-containing protein